MKRYISVLLSILLAAAALSLPSAAEGYRQVAQEKTNIIGGITLMKRVNGVEESAALLTSAGSKPAAAVYPVDDEGRLPDGSPIAEVLAAADDDIIPVFAVDGEAALQTILRSIEKDENEWRDCLLLSSDAALITEAGKTAPLVCGILDRTEAYRGKTALDGEERLALRREVASCGARIVLLPDSLAAKREIEALSHLQLTPFLSREEPLTDQCDALTLLLSGAYGICSDNPALLASLACELPEKTLTRTPLNIGHRGIPAQNTRAPENTVESALLAYEAGANAIELDIYITRDGVLMVNHNSDTTTIAPSGKTEQMIDESTGKPVRVAIEGTTSDKLKGYYYAGYGESRFRMSTLAEYFEAFADKDVELIIEIKSKKTNLVPKLKELIEQYGMYGKCHIISYESTGQGGMMRRKYPEMTFGLLMGANAVKESYLAVEAILAETQPFRAAASPDKGGYSASLIRACTYRGLPVSPYTFNAQNEVAQYITYGAASTTGNDASVYGDWIRDFSVTAPESAAAGDSFSLTVDAMNYRREKIEPQIKIELLEGAENVAGIDGNTVRLNGSGAGGTVTLLVSNQEELVKGQTVTHYEQPITVRIEKTESAHTQEASVSEPRASFFGILNLLPLVLIAVIVIVFLLVKRRRG